MHTPQISEKSCQIGIWHREIKPERGAWIRKEKKSLANSPHQHFSKEKHFCSFQMNFVTGSALIPFDNSGGKSLLRKLIMYKIKGGILGP